MPESTLVSLSLDQVGSKLFCKSFYLPLKKLLYVYIELEEAQVTASNISTP